MMPGQSIDLVRTLVLGVLGPALLLGGCASFGGNCSRPRRSSRARARSPGNPLGHFDLLTQISIAPPPPGEPLRVLALLGGGDDGPMVRVSQRMVANRQATWLPWSWSQHRARRLCASGDYDDELKRLYRDHARRHLQGPLRVGDPVLDQRRDAGPLEALIARFAASGDRCHRRRATQGRRLFVGTVSLDRPGNAIWDMGAIAAGDAPGRYALFRRILLASSSVPVQFPPVLIEMEAQGERISELHVDGGTIATLMAAPPVANDQILRDSQSPTELYLLVNGKMAGEFELIEAGLSSIAKRTLEVMLFSSLQDRVASAYVWVRSMTPDIT